MTYYHGGKKRIGRTIAQHIKDNVEESGMIHNGYCEPFCGMCGVYRHVPALFGTYLTYVAGDANESVVQMWHDAQRGWVPPTTCDREHFFELRGDGQSSAEKGFLGHACTFRGIYFQSWTTVRRNLPTQSNDVVRMATSALQDVSFTPGEYTQFSNLHNYIIYCDPPYRTKSQYYDETNHLKQFDVDAFFEWIDMMSKRNTIFFTYGDILHRYHIVAEVSTGEYLYVVENI